MKNPLLAIFFILMGYLQGVGQTSHIEHLRREIKIEKEDSNKVITLDSLSLELKNIGSNDSSLHYAKISQLLASNLGYKKGLAVALRIIGVVYYHQADYPNALLYLNNSLSTDKEIGNRSGIASELSNIGNVYDAQGNYPKALESDLTALSIFEEIHNKAGCSKNYTNIGLIYFEQGNNALALKYHLKALALDQELGDKDGTSSDLNNIGAVYSNTKNYDSALNYMSKALVLKQELGDKENIANETLNIGEVYFNEGKYGQVAGYIIKALSIFREIGDKQGIAESLTEYGNLCSFEKNYKQAKSYFDSALLILKAIDDINYIKITYQDLTFLDSATGNYRQEIDDYRKFIIYRDSLANDANTKRETQAEMNYTFTLKTDSANAVQERKDELAEADKRKQNIITYLVGGGLLLVLILAGLIFRSLRITRKQKQLIEVKSRETEQQKLLVEEKNKDITDSINYAKRIQRALLKEEEHVSMHLPQHFILFKPKDIVSGDFYWAAEKEEYFYFAAVDCTGHGVPGGFMSMLGMAFLNEIIKGAAAIQTPAEILDELRTKILTEFKQKEGEDQTKDGMDISLMRMNLKTREIEWSGANNPLYVINDVAKETPADKQPIGYFPLMKPFTNHIVKVEKDSILYLFSDGYADQFGGPKGKKFRYSALKELLFSIHQKSMKEQKKILNETFESWKGNLEQVDDVLIIGVRV